MTAIVGILNKRVAVMAADSDESVGGPIDVAVITRSEGFIWVKHKDWFQKDLNPQIKMFD